MYGKCHIEKELVNTKMCLSYTSYTDEFPAVMRAFLQ
jgi:hypothetical protein